MTAVFYISALIAIVTTVLAITRVNAIHALLNLVVSFLALGLVFYTLGAPFAAVLEVIIYSGAIMVVFVFVVMMLNVATDVSTEKAWLKSRMWIAPGLCALILAVEFVYLFLGVGATTNEAATVSPSEVGFSLYTRYLLGVEMASMLLLAGLVGAYHLGARRQEETSPVKIKEEIHP